VLVRDFALVRADPREVAADAAHHAARLARRAGIA